MFNPATDPNNNGGIGTDTYSSLMQQMMAFGGSSAMKSNPWTGIAFTTLGGIQTAIALKKLKELDKKGVPKFAATDELNNSIKDADAMRGIGFTAPETAAYQSRISRSQNTGFERGKEMAPSLTSAIQAGINYANEEAQLNFAAKDAELNRSNIRYSDTLRRMKQTIADRNTEVDIGEFKGKQQAYGQAMQAGINNAMYGVTSLANTDFGGNEEGNTKTPKTTKYKAGSRKANKAFKGVGDDGTATPKYNTGIGILDESYG